MSARPVLFFTTSTGNLGDTTVQIELARACAADFEPIFLCYGFKFHHLVRAAGFRTLFPPPYRRSRIAPQPQKFLRQIEAEAAILRRYRPVAVINKHEMGPIFSARLAGVPLIWHLPYAWTRHCQQTHWSGQSPLQVATHWFNGQPLPDATAFLWPYQETARLLGLVPPRDFHDLFTGDLILIHELQALVGAHDVPDHYRFIGPIIAQLPGELPAVVTTLDQDRPIIYFAMGSSGDPQLLPAFLDLFSARPAWQVIAPIAKLLGEMDLAIPPNVLVTDWLPALAANRLADLAITHGGIGTLMTACLAGTPTIALGMFPEQTLCVQLLAHHAAVRPITRQMVSRDQLQFLIEDTLTDTALAARARAVQELLKRSDGPACGAATLRRFLLE